MRGIIIINKEAGMTSFGVVARLRHILKTKKIGHTGTLDPEATGVLPVCVGSATKAVEFLINHRKEYIAGFRLGVTTDTLDIHGEVLSTKESKVTKSEIQEVLEHFRGEIQQLTPMFSARKVDGHKLVDLARRGIEVERNTVSVYIHQLELLKFDETKQEGQLRVICSGGTYIRTLCNDIGDALQVGGCMTTLKRTAVGDYTLSESYTLSEVEEFARRGNLGIPMFSVDSLYMDLPEAHVSPEAEKYLKNGNPLNPDEITTESFALGQYRIYLHRVFYGIYEKRRDGNFYPYKMYLPEEEERAYDRVVTIGKFDGLHKGHQSLLAAMKEEHPELKKTLVTFDFENSEGFRKDYRLFTEEERRYLAASLGFDEVIIYPFTKELREMSPEAFIKELLVKELSAKALYCGENFCFGYKRLGNADYLRKNGESLGLECHILPEVTEEEAVISSTVLREEISENNLIGIEHRMGFPYFIRGVISYGKQLGNTIGFPTINLAVSSEKLLPKHGVYASITVMNGRLYYGMTNVGVNPTVSDTMDPKVETNLFDYNGDCYGEAASVFLCEFTREEKHFHSVEELLTQLEQDRIQIQTYANEGHYRDAYDNIRKIFGISEISPLQ